MRAAVWAAAALSILAGPALAAPSVVPVDVAVSGPTTPVRGGDRLHLLYELRLTNFSGRTLTLERLETRAAAGGRSLESYDARALAGMIVHPGQKGGDAPLAIAPGGFAVLFLDTQVAASAAPPSAVVHRLRFKADKPDTPDSRVVIDGIVEPVSARPVVVLGPPLRGAGWLAANALSNDADHRRTVTVVDGKARIAQRYAIDFVQLDAQGRAFKGDPARNESWVGYGAPVLAVADGVVAAVKDDLPDNTPGQPSATPINLDTIGGNHVVLDMGGGRRVFYGHLKPGSVSVRQGQKVKRGQVIGRLGDSGQSDAPHLHIHVSDGVSALGAEGLAYAFDAYRVQGQVPSLEILEKPEGWVHDALTPRAARRELPTENAVVDFAP